MLKLAMLIVGSSRREMAESLSGAHRAQGDAMRYFNAHKLARCAQLLGLGVGMGLGLGLLNSCEVVRPAVLYGSENHLKPTDYPMVLRTWTRSAKIYRGLDDKLFVTATYHAPELRRAFALAFPDIYGHGGKITRRELVDLTGGVEQHHNFLLAVYTPDVRWNDLGRDDSIWRLSLHGSQDIEVGPDEVVPIKMDENLRAVYPYITRFDKVYLVRFPLVDALQRMVIEGDATSIALRIASALGGADMQWQLQKVDLAQGPKSSAQHSVAPDLHREQLFFGTPPWVPQETRQWLKTCSR